MCSSLQEITTKGPPIEEVHIKERRGFPFRQGLFIVLRINLVDIIDGGLVYCIDNNYWPADGSKGCDSFYLNGRGSFFYYIQYIAAALIRSNYLDKIWSWFEHQIFLQLINLFCENQKTSICTLKLSAPTGRRGRVSAYAVIRFSRPFTHARR